MGSVQMGRCADGMVCRWDGVQMGWCADGPVCRWAGVQMEDTVLLLHCMLCAYI